jgi:UDP-N-acetylmuramoylalanine--D-glutamate ligase
MENYAAVKARMFMQQGQGDTALIGVDDDYCRAIADGIPAKATTRRVSVVNDLPQGISAPEGVLRDKNAGKTIAEIDLRAMPALKGRHNWQNACMAYGVAAHFSVPVAKVAEAMMSFPGLAHRMQQIGTIGAIAFVNDSKATNADAAEKALSSFDNIYWIAGGIAKTGGIEPLAPLFPRITKAYLIGTAAPEFAKTLDGKVPPVISETLANAVSQALADASNDKKGNPVILLSPACASFDQYKNFEIRGDAFVQLVASMPGVTMAQSQNGGKA